MANTTDTTWSNRPEKHSERTEIVGFLKTNDVEHLNVVVTAQYDLGYRAGELAYAAARTANNDAYVKALWTGKQLGTYNTGFNASFKRWLGMAETLLGGSLAARLSPVLGNRVPSRFVEWNVPDKIETFERFFTLIDQFPELVGDPAWYAAMKDAAESLELARLENDGAIKVRGAKVRALGAAARDFDRWYGALVKTIRLTDPDGIGATLPRFRRVKGEVVEESDPEYQPPVEEAPVEPETPAEDASAAK